MQRSHKTSAIAGAALLACLYALAAPAETVQEPNGPPVGSPAPDFKVRNEVSGEEVALSGLQGKVVVMTFWATWCPSCREELPVLERIQEIVGEDNLAVLAVNYRENPDSWGRLKRAAAKWRITLVDDQRGSLARRYRVSLIPHMFIIDRDGKVFANHLGYGRSMNTELAAELNRALQLPRAASAEDSSAPNAVQPHKTVADNP